ncbi:DMT family transporter [Comamonas resistens]|uniref:EamA family transporter n=1 Tax=Comamonas resistens TaxID=3046670 RepID=A0ABY8STB1_9BURK|nr:EamA family transporter [Comamonas resistens]MDL5037351.1 EamA family transporter [Comamonas resistens]WHS65486.1 EamA family transporter [Comamonas resistens]
MSLASLIRLLALAALWGGSFLFMRVAVPHLGAVPTAVGRGLFSTLGLGATLAIMGYRPRLGRYLWPLLALGVINSGIPFLMYALAAQVLPSGYSAIFNATTPLVATVVGALVFAEAITPARVAAVLLGIGGVAVLAQAGPLDLSAAVLGGMAACFVATVCYAFSSYLTLRLAGANASVDTRAAVFISQLGALMVLTPALLLDMALEPGMLARLQAAPLLAWGNVAVLGLLSTALAYVLYFRLIADEGPQKALTVTFIVPVFAVLWGWALLDESLTVAHAMGGGLIALSLWLVLRPKAD